MSANKSGIDKLKIEELALLAKDGDQNAFAEIYDELVDPIYRYVFYRVKSEDAEDIVETVFLKVWENVRRYKKVKGSSFSSWVYRIAHNLVVDYYRGQKGRRVEELSDILPDDKREHNPIKMTQRRLNDDVLRLAISKLKKNYREIVVLKYLNELSNTEIAEILKKSEGSIRILQHRALKALKVELESLGVKY